MDLVTPVAASILIRDGKVLLIRRKGKTFDGLLSIPGGKIDFGETIESAALRELGEETGVKASFRRHLATIPEHITENGRVIKHLMIQLCELDYQGDLGTREFEPVWVPLADLGSVRGEMTPSDYHMIQDILLSDSPGTWFSLLEKTADGYVQKEFRRI
jgi:mutator protein MutT